MEKQYQLYKMKNGDVINLSHDVIVNQKHIKVGNYINTPSQSNPKAIATDESSESTIGEILEVVTIKYKFKDIINIIKEFFKAMFGFPKLKYLKFVVIKEK